MPRFRGPKKVGIANATSDFANADIEKAEQKIIDNNSGKIIANHDLIQNSMSFKFKNNALNFYHIFKYFSNNLLHSGRSGVRSLPINIITNKEFSYVNNYYDTFANIIAVYTCSTFSAR